MKNNKFLKSLSVIFAGIMISSAFSACRKTPTSDSKGSVKESVSAVSPITDKLERGTIDNALHKVNVTPSSRTFVKGARSSSASTEYKILADNSNNYALRAASFMSGQLNAATNASFKVELYNDDSENPVTSSSKYIIIGCKNLFTQCGLSMPEDELGPAGYYIKSFGNSVFIEVFMNDGYQMGTLAFLREVVGYDMIAHDTVAYEKDGATLPDMEIIERPDYDYRNMTNWMTEDGKYGMGYNYQSIFTYISQDGGKTDKSSVHNIFKYLPVEKYLKDHPYWYSSNSTHRQLCYTAHGDEQEYALMQKAMLEVMLKCVLAQPDQGVVTVTQEDAAVCCDCEECTRVVEKDGSISATIIRFMNDLDDKFQVALSAYAEETGTERRTVQLAFFAYHTSYNPPTTSVKDDPTLKCSPNITVFIAPINARYVNSFYEEENRVYADTVRAWSEYTDNIMAWVYETNYHHYMFPYNTYSSMMDTYYFFKQQGANIIYNEGQRWSENVTCFGKLKEYLDAKAQFDVTVSYEECKDKFFKNYYGAAADIMEQYYNELRQWETYLESVQDYGLGGGIYEEIGLTTTPHYWPKEMLEDWLDLMDNAKKSLVYLELENPVLYQKLIKHIEIEELFPKYALCTLHESSYTSSAMLQMRKDFKIQADRLGLLQHEEHDYITTIYKQWGLI